VVWTNVVNASASGNNLTKTNGTTAWNAGASSVNVIRDGYGYMEFTATETNMRIAGLSNGDSNQDYTDIDFGLLIRSDASVAIYEAGTYRGEFGYYSAYDRFRLEVRYGVVRYLRNGSVLYTSPSVPRYPLRVDTALYDVNATLTDVRIGNLVWSSPSGASISGENLTKTGSDGWNAGAISTNTIEAGDGFMEFTATETNTTRIAGLANGDSTQSYEDIEFGIELRSDSIVEIFESGTSLGTAGAYVNGDRFRVELSSGVIRYYRNSTLLYTSTGTPAYPLRVDSSLNTAGATLTDVSLESLIWTNALGVSVQGTKLKKVASNGWNAGASSTGTITNSADAWMEFTALEINTRRVAGLKTDGSASDYTGINFAIELGDTGTLTIWELGTSRGNFGSYSAGDRLRVEIQDGSVRYRKNGAILYTSSVVPTYPLHTEATLYTTDGTLVDVAMGDIVWKSETGLKMLGNGLQKTNTSNSWNTAGAVSTKAVNSGYVEWMATETVTYRIAGLGYTDSNQDYTDIDFGILWRSDMSVAIYESGNYRGEFGTYAPGDRFKVEVLNNVVKYYRNGTLLYTSTVTPALPLRIDTAFRETAGTLSNFIFSGTPVVQQLAPPTVSVATGTYNTVQSVTLSHGTTNVTIRYTTDGSTPNSSSPIYTVPITVDQPMTLKTLAQKASFLDSSVASANYTMKVGTLSVSPGGATYNSAQTVTLSTVTPSATIRYTTDGSDPTGSSPVYSAPITVGQSLTLKARGTRTGWTDSDLASSAYTMKVAALSFSLAPGTYNGVQTVTVTTATSGVTLRYTTDGSEPTATSLALPGNTITVDHTSTVKIQGFRTGWSSSDILRGTYYITLGTAGTPVISPAAGTYTAAQAVTISTATNGATIRYTTDGTEPNPASRIYTGQLVVLPTTEIRAKAYKSDYTASATATAFYVIDSGTVDPPRVSPGSGIYPVFQTVTVRTETTGATIHYTTNGADPTESDPTVASGGTLTVDKSTTLKLKPWKSGVPASDVIRANYQITGAVAAGEKHSLAVKADGTVWSWGTNQYGALGRAPYGGTTPNTSPGQVAITDVVAVAAGWLHSLALKRDGTVWAWGKADNGQVGPGSSSIAWNPVPVTGLSNVIAIAAASYHSLALKSDGTVWIWGSDLMVNDNTPSQVAGLKGITQIAAAWNQSVVLKTDGEDGGTVWTWDHNEFGQLGDGTYNARGAPVMVAGLNDAVAIDSGGAHTLAVRRDATVWSWGWNEYSQLGGNPGYSRPVPGEAGISIGTVGRTNPLAGQILSTLVLMRPSIYSKSQVVGLGTNDSGQLGTGSTTGAATKPALSLMQDAVVLTAAHSGSHALAIHIDGRLFVWGYNAYGQLGDGSTITRPTPAAISAFSLVDNSWLQLDSDSDGLSNLLEMELGTDPTNADTNGDGIPDGVATYSGADATNPDIDGDGLTNAKEREIGTDPFQADTDGDGAPDKADCFPLDPGRSQCPAPVPGDVTPPVILLQEPTNAVLTGSTP